MKRKIYRRKHKYTLQEEMNYMQLKCELDGVAKSFQKNPCNSFLRGKFFYLKRNFRRILKSTQKRHKQNMLHQIQSLQHNNPQAFWKLYNSLKNKDNKAGDFDPEVFHDYFKSLHGVSSNKHFDKEFQKRLEKKLKNIQGKNWVEILDKCVDAAELKSAVQSAKPKKACGFDAISNEMIKCSLEKMSKVLLKLFNHVIHSEEYPELWAEGYISPLLKKGHKLNPANYRGLTISSCLGKIFNRIMNNRLMKFLEISQLIEVNQIGFIPGKRTTDHIFVLKTLIDLAKQKRKPLYLCFVDLKSAFDTVWRKGLYYKLIQLNISNKFLNILKSMYTKVNVSVKCQEGYTDRFPVLTGTKQGCNLSPTLFNCYLNDLVPRLDETCASQPSLSGKKVSCLLYADDLILLSHTPFGLQKLISYMEEYCNKWQLQMNTEKTKVMVLNKRDNYNKWFVYDKEIEKVSKFCYLGIELDNGGKFKPGINRLYNKACRAFIRLREKFNFYNGTPVRVMVNLFDSIIQPVLTYGCEIWGLYEWRKQTVQCIRNAILKKEIMAEKLHNRFCKQVLGIDRQVPATLAKAELGRYPVMGKIVQHCYTFWQHVLASSPGSLTNYALITSVEMDRAGTTSYYTRIKNLLAVLNAKPAIYPKDAKSVKFVGKSILSKYKSMYEHFFLQILETKRQCPESKGKYEIYCKIKRKYRFEPYLEKIEDHKLRRYITGIRCTYNNFPVNQLRKKGIDRDERYCHLCNAGVIGSELHVTMFCRDERVTSCRNDLVSVLKTLSTQIIQLTKEQLFNYLVQAVDSDSLFYFAIFLRKIDKILAKP